MKRIDIMVDIETLGKKENSLVFQIAACAFDLSTGSIIEPTFNLTVDISHIDDITVQGSTLLWWLKTDKELLAKLLSEGTVSEKELFKSFAEWINSFKEIANDMTVDNVFLWGNGMLFDNKLIQAKMDRYGIDYPIFYRNDRDMRTIMEIAALKKGFSNEYEFRKSMRKPELKAHDAFDDVRSQIADLVTAWKILFPAAYPENIK